MVAVKVVSQGGHCGFRLTREPRPYSLHIGMRHVLCIKHEILKSTVSPVNRVTKTMHEKTKSCPRPSRIISD